MDPHGRNGRSFSGAAKQLRPGHDGKVEEVWQGHRADARFPACTTAEAAMGLLNDLKAGGYKIVFMRPKFAVTTIAAYDEITPVSFAAHGSP